MNLNINSPAYFARNMEQMTMYINIVKNVMNISKIKNTVKC